MTTTSCPVCGHEQDKENWECIWCGWDFSPLLGTPEQVEALQRERLTQAQAAWRQRRYNPELIPELERDPFETPEEFAARLAERLWYVGVGELRKAEFNIETGQFPLGIRSHQPWASSWIGQGGSYSLCLPRAQACALYQRGETWPLYARLAKNDSHVSLTALVMVTPDNELPVKILKIPLISMRYLDLGNGTVVDTKTGLQWMRCALGQSWDGRNCCGNAENFTWGQLWAQVDAFKEKGGYVGHVDWRVPTVDELKTLIVENAKPAIDLEAFPETPCGWFWSSSPLAGYASYAWSVDFSNGYVGGYGKDGAGYVRLVRGGQ